MNTRPGMVWKMRGLGMMMPESHRGIRERRMPPTRPTANPMTTETSTYTVCRPMAWSSSAP